MSKRRGRGGKKQRYAIADIGGADLTSQDVSTEKVLNFLIRGGLSDAEGHDESSKVDDDDHGQHVPLVNEPSLHAEDVRDATRAAGTPPQRRSLDHLFSRANKGAPVKETAPAGEVVVEAVVEAVVAELARPAPPPEEDSQSPKLLTDSHLQVGQSSPLAHPPAAETPHTGPSDSPVSPERLGDSSPPQDTVSLISAASPRGKSAPATVNDYEAELSYQIERWKGFYRLKDGEVSALSTLFRLSHALGSSECYVKMHDLAETSNLTYRYCQKVVRGLEQLGWIVKLKDYDSSTRMGVLYRVNLKPTE